MKINKLKLYWLASLDTKYGRVKLSVADQM